MRSKTSKQIETAMIRRRGVAAVWTAVTATLMIGFVALAIDLGHVRLVKAQLQNAADAAAMAGASALIDPAGVAGSTTPEQRASLCKSRAATYANKNRADGQYLQLTTADVSVGNISQVNNLQEDLTPGATPYNAVKVLVRKAPDASNGPVTTYFATIWGQDTASISATATAFLDGRMCAYRPVDKPGPLPLVPITVRKAKWDLEIVAKTGNDGFGYDPANQTITSDPDGVPELSIFPEKQKDSDEPDGAGDFGLLQLGDGSQGVPEIGSQIENGVGEEEITATFGEPEIRFYTDQGDPITHVVDGIPGVKNSLVQLDRYLKSRIGDVIAFFTHDNVTKSGTNATYDIVGIQFGRLMYTNAHGSLGKKAVVIQPVAYVGQEVITSDQAPVHDTAGRIQLVR